MLSTLRPATLVVLLFVFVLLLLLGRPFGAAGLHGFRCFLLELCHCCPRPKSPPLAPSCLVSLFERLWKPALRQLQWQRHAAVGFFLVQIMEDYY